jgi:glycerol-3-phosphate acyltransferase PlsY
MWAALLVLLLAYLFGSIPAGVVVARTYGVDIRKVGSGNIGATNVLRALGWGPALVVAFFDVFKGGHRRAHRPGPGASGLASRRRGPHGGPGA